MKNYFEYPFFYDDVPIDISFIFEDEKPAGKHGFLGIDGRRFVFEDGTVGKFWGVNFNGAGCFPEHEYAKKLAKRLSKLGVNLVRMHQLDAEWHTPNIFRATKGKRVTDGHLDPSCMEKLDYLIACLKDEGIYVYLDMLTYRKFRSDEGVENAHILVDAAKPYSTFSRRMIELQKEFCTEIWTHYNPYTCLKYCDDPVFVMTEITNECDIFGKFHLGDDYEEPYASEFREYFNEWLKNKGSDRRAEDVCLNDNEDRDLLDFKIYKQEEYYRELYRCLRDAGVKIPIAGTNWNRTPDNYRSQLVCDFLDTHAYLTSWGWKEFEKRSINTGITEIRPSYIRFGSLIASCDRPTYISEWDIPWPNERRAESVLYTAAISAFQGWSGCAIHTYSYSAKLENVNMLGREVSAPKIGDVPYRQGVFCTWNDPAKMGLFYHAALIVRRGDVSEGKTLYGITPKALNRWNDRDVETNIDKYKVVTNLDGSHPLPEVPDETSDTFAASDNGELLRDWGRNYGIIDTDRTKCVYGSLCKNGRLELKNMTVETQTDFGVIALSSLTDDALTSSDNILLTAVGRAENTGAVVEGELTLDLGRPPVVVETIRTTITLDTPYTDMTVWAVSAEGYYIGRVPVSFENGKMTFTLGETSRSMYYLIVRS